MIVFQNAHNFMSHPYRIDRLTASAMAGFALQCNLKPDRRPDRNDVRRSVRADRFADRLSLHPWAGRGLFSTLQGHDRHHRLPKVRGIYDSVDDIASVWIIADGRDAMIRQAGRWSLCQVDLNLNS